MYLPREKFESLRTTIGWHKTESKMTSQDLELITDAYASQLVANSHAAEIRLQIACLDAYNSDLKEYKELANAQVHH